MKKEDFKQLCWLFRLFLIAINTEYYQSNDFKIGEFKYAVRLTAVEHTLHIELLKKIIRLLLRYQVSIIFHRNR